MWKERSAYMDAGCIASIDYNLVRYHLFDPATMGTRLKRKHLRVTATCLRLYQESVAFGKAAANKSPSSIPTT